MATQPDELQRSDRITILLSVVAIILSIVSISATLIIAWSQVVAHDQDNLQGHQQQCTNALINLYSELNRRSFLVATIGQSSTDPADRQRATDSDVALIGAWTSEHVACEDSNLINRATSVGQNSVEARSKSERKIATSDSNATVEAVAFAIQWVSDAVYAVERVRLKNPLRFDDSWSYPSN